MGSRIGFILFLVLVISYTNADARSLVTLDAVELLSDDKIPSKVSEANTRNEQVCTLCEEYSAQAITYLSENETQTQIIHALHHACSLLHSFKKQCVLLADYYAPLFFVEIAKIRPDQFCSKVNLCEEMALVRLPRPDDACKLCHQVVVDILMKIKDPDTQLEIIELLLKGCNKVENFVQECKRLVFQYGPLVLANAEKFLETTDVCASIHVCKVTHETVNHSLLVEDTEAEETRGPETSDT